MKKLITIFILGAVTLFAFTACGGNGDADTETGAAQDTAIATDDTQANEPPQDNAPLDTGYAQHPFAIALTEYFADGVEASDGSAGTKAFTATVDNIPVVVAIRHEIRPDEAEGPIPVARIFYMTGGNLNHFDIETFQGRPPLVVLDVGLALAGGHWTNQWTTMLGMEGGGLTRTHTIFILHDAEDLSGENPEHYIVHGDWTWRDGFENLTPITQEEFNDIFSAFEVIEWWWEDLDDETEQILAMDFR